MKKSEILRFFMTRKLLRQELSKLIRQNEYLKAQLAKKREREEGFGELIKIYEAVIVYLGEAVKGLQKDNTKSFDERVGEILALLKNDG